MGLGFSPSHSITSTIKGEGEWGVGGGCGDTSVTHQWASCRSKGGRETTEGVSSPGRCEGKQKKRNFFGEIFEIKEICLWFGSLY